jgi:hypothetical protein
MGNQIKPSEDLRQNVAQTTLVRRDDYYLTSRAACVRYFCTTWFICLLCSQLEVPVAACAGVLRPLAGCLTRWPCKSTRRTPGVPSQGSCRDQRYSAGRVH